MPIKHLQSLLVATTAAALLAFAGGAVAQESPGVTPAAAQPAPGTYVLDPTHTALFWSVKHNGMSNYTARFERVTGSLVLDPTDIARSSLEVSVDPASVQVAYPANYRETHPGAQYDSWAEAVSRDPQMLNSTAFPEITFRSTAVTRTGEASADVVGDLTFLGVTRPVTMKAALTGSLDSHPVAGTPVVSFVAETTFDRTAFGQPVGFAGREVTVRFDGEFVQDPAALAAQ